MPGKLTKRQIILIFGGGVLALGLLLVLFFNLRTKPPAVVQSALTVWGTEDSTAFKGIAESYPYAKVTYVQVDPSDYNTKLLGALAGGVGPDVFEIGSHDLPKWKSILAPFPTSTSVFGLPQLAQLFPDVVQQDFVSNGSIYGLPLTIDTMVMVYNKDLFNAAGIVFPPTTWNELDTDIGSLRKVNSQGQLIQAGAAIGGSTVSIPNAADLVSLLMLQNGTPMTNPGNTQASFAMPDNGAPGLAAFNFYLQFANAASQNYTWNDDMGDALAAFVNGKTAIMFVYQADITKIKARAPFINMGIAPMLQAQGAAIPVNYPKYNGFVAAKAGRWPDALNFILYLTTASGDGRVYQSATGQLSALRTDIQADMADPILKVYAGQTLTARSWYEADSVAVGAIFDKAIKNVQSGAEDSPRALSEAEAAVSQLIGNSHQ